MNLIRVLQTGYGVQSFQVGTNVLGQQCFNVDSGNALLTIDMIVDMAERELKFSNGPETIQAREPRTPSWSPEVEALVREWD